MTVLPTFQPQNPAITGYPLGWSSCTTYAGAMAAAFDQQKQFVMSGEALRRETGDTSGGTNLGQVDAALVRRWKINLSVHYRLPWATFQKLIDGGCGAILQGWYAPIADTRFDAGRGFRGNHAVFVPPSWAAMDPLADGRASGVYKYDSFTPDPYPRSLLRSFAGKLNISATNVYRPLGDGLVYAAITRDVEHTYAIHFTGKMPFWVYTVVSGKIINRRAEQFTKDTQVACTPPRRYEWPAENSTRTLVMVNNPRSPLNGEYIQVPQGAVRLEVVP